MLLAAPRVSSVRLVWTHDLDGEPDYLETTAKSHYGKDGDAWSHVSAVDINRVNAEFGSVWDACVAYANQNAEHLSRFKAGDWWFEGCYAVAEISYENSTRSYRLAKLRSAGLWGIESDSGSEYRKLVEADELADLSQHLKKFGISASVDDLIALSENSSY